MTRFESSLQSAQSKCPLGSPVFLQKTQTPLGILHSTQNVFVSPSFVTLSHLAFAIMRYDSAPDPPARFDCLVQLRKKRLIIRPVHDCDAGFDLESNTAGGEVGKAFQAAFALSRQRSPVPSIFVELFLVSSAFEYAATLSLLF